MIQAITLSPLELLLARADELKERKTDTSQAQSKAAMTVFQRSFVRPVVKAKKGKAFSRVGQCRDCGNPSNHRSQRLGLCPDCRREHHLRQLRLNNAIRRGYLPAKNKSRQASVKPRVETWQQPPCCERCSGPGPLSKRLKLCQECLYRHNEQVQQKHRVYRLVSTPADHRMELTYDEYTPTASCPTCGRCIDPDLPACMKHMTTVLMRMMRGTPVEV
jgi:hypothetical protein